VSPAKLGRYQHYRLQQQLGRRLHVHSRSVLIVFKAVRSHHAAVVKTALNAECEFMHMWCDSTLFGEQLVLKTAKEPPPRIVSRGCSCM
jgi:hypothetical protein